MAQQKFRVQEGIIFPDGTEQTTAYVSGTTSTFVVVNVEGTVWSSTDGENWDGPFDTGLSGLERVAVGPNTIVYIADDAADEGENLYYTTAWNETPVRIEDPEIANWSQVRYFADIGRFVAVGEIDGTPTYKHSANGITWTVVPLDNAWAGTLNEGAGYGSAEFRDIATNGFGFLLVTNSTVLGSFYTTTLTSNTDIGSSEWLDDGCNFSRVVYSENGVITGWFAFGDGDTGAGSDAWWLNSSVNPSGGSFSTGWGISDISEVFADEVGYQADWSELVIGRYNNIDTIVIASTDGQVLYWPAVPAGPFVVVPKPYTRGITGISNLNPAVITYTPSNVHANNEKITITGVTPSEFNGTYYINNSYQLFTDSAMIVPFDATALTYVSGGTVTFSSGQYIDALNYANGNFYVGNDDEEIFVSSDGGETWTEVASLTGEAGEGEGLGYLNDIDGYVNTVAINTGDVTFDGNKIIGTGDAYGGNGLNLTPGPSLDADMYFRIHGGDNPTHLHLSVGDTAVYDQYFGNDNKYLKLGLDGVISIGTNSNTWTFGEDGSLTVPGDVRSEGNINIDINLSDSTLHRWQFGEDGKLTMPGAVVNSTVAKTGTDPLANDVLFQVTQVDEFGAVTEAVVTNSPNPSWVSNTSGLALGDVDFTVNFDGSGNATVIINSSGTGHSNGDTWSIPATAVGATAPTPTAIDLTKSINKLTDGSYTLADGVEGQIIYLVRQTAAVATNITVTVANARVDGVVYTPLDQYPFDLGPGGAMDISTLIFTDGAWQAIGGTWD